jgi:Ca-activated chloride channel family protein
MYLLREYGAFAILACGLAAALLAMCGIGYLLKLVSAKFLSGIRAYSHRVGSLDIPVPAVRTTTQASAAVLLLLALLSVSHAQTPAPPPDSPYTINVSVDEVVVHATVRNRKGTPVAGLGKENFQVFEDKVLQPIKHFSHEDIPVTVGLVIDNSGSMGPKRAEVITAALAFAASSNPLDQMFLVNFNEHVRFGLPPDVLFTDSPGQLKDAMRTVKADGKTALYDAVAVALERLEKGDRDKKVLIVVSDGADNASSRTKEEMLGLARRSNAIIYAMGIYEPDDPDRSPHVLSELAHASGGEAYFPETLRDVRPACERIAHEVRTQYTLSYVPTNQKQDGSYRAIQVRAATQEGRGLYVSTRAGYVAPVKPAAAPKAEARN